MAIKRILLPVGGGESFEALLDTAFHLGERFSALLRRCRRHRHSPAKAWCLPARLSA
jgi:hypothetical protein